MSGDKLPSGSAESAEPWLRCQALSGSLACVLFMRISPGVQKLQTDWPMFASSAGQRGDYAKQEALGNQIKNHRPEKWVA